MELQNHPFDRLMVVGEGHGLRLVRARARNWLRQEKSGHAVDTEFGCDASLPEAGLDRFVDRMKELRDPAAMEARDIHACCVAPWIDDPRDADPRGRKVLHHDGAVVGRLASGGCSMAFGRSIGMGSGRLGPHGTEDAAACADAARSGSRL